MQTAQQDISVPLLPPKNNAKRDHIVRCVRLQIFYAQVAFIVQATQLTNTSALILVNTAQMEPPHRRWPARGVTTVLNQLQRSHVTRVITAVRGEQFRYHAQRERTAHFQIRAYHAKTDPTAPRDQWMEISCVKGATTAFPPTQKHDARPELTAMKAVQARLHVRPEHTVQTALISIVATQANIAPEEAGRRKYAPLALIVQIHAKNQCNVHKT
jgi:hypothetical protein